VPGLTGRATEVERVSAFIRDGGAALLVRGEPGIGKSALLAVTARAARSAGVRVLAATGVESETGLPFAGLHQLLRPVLDRAEALPGPQRTAILAAFGVLDADPPDLFLIGLATLNLLDEVAGGGPVLVLVEDVNWLDAASAEALAFVARRLDGAPIALLASARDDYRGVFTAAGLPELWLDRLDEEQSAALLARHAPDLPADLRRRILAEAAGNPLALVELPRLADLAEAASPGPLPLTGRLERAFAARLAGLPAATRTLLLTIALNDGDGLAESLAAAGAANPTTDAAADGPAAVAQADLAPAVAAGLIEVDRDRVTFRHPLIRSAVDGGAAGEDRRAVHAALGAALAGQPERQVWHLAAASPGPDEAVAGELEAAARRAQRRGAVAVALTALERAAWLSTDPRRRADRLLAAAELATELGRPEQSGRLLDALGPLGADPALRPRVTLLRGRFHSWLTDGPAGIAPLIAAAETATERGDPALAMRLFTAASVAIAWIEPGPELRAALLRAVLRADVAADDPGLILTLAFADPIGQAGTVIERVAARARAGDIDPLAGRLLAQSVSAVGDVELSLGLIGPALAGLRAQGRLGLVALALTVRLRSATLTGDLSLAIPTAEELIRLAEETAMAPAEAFGWASAGLVAAMRGDEEQTEALAARAEQVNTPLRSCTTHALTRQARGFAALGAGRPSEALDHLLPIQDRADPAYHILHRVNSLGDLAEAAARSGRREAVSDIMTEFEALGVRTPSPLLHAGLHHARAVLADDEEHYTAALAADLRAFPFTRARVQLAYGEWLRRQRRVTDSRAFLRTARETFDTLGTIPWSVRARRELRAAGESSSRLVPAARDRLTPQELLIAQLAAEGLTNREIGHRLYLSHRTVSTHLHKIFPKLGITSRAALSATL